MRHARRGKSLVEMLILITILGVVMGITATTLVALFKTDRQLRRDLAQLTTLARLGSHFRTDVHAATACQVEQGCNLTLPDGRIVRYAVEGHSLHRQILRGEAIEHRDAFALPDTAVVSFEQPTGYNARLVRLTIQAKPDADKPYLTPVRPTSIDAVVGLTRAKQEPQP